MPFLPPPRLDQRCYVGLQRYFLTICTHKRQKVFVTAAAVNPVIARLLETTTGHEFALVVYCMMPDHVHALFEALSDNADLGECVRIFKQTTSFDWKRRTGTRLWQRSYFDRVLRADEDTPSVARYILANPVRAGLVTHPLEYPYSGSRTMDVRDLLDSVA
jgi:REP element-mobilizing transposase RayT